jgi:hypothetical protein
LIYVHNIFAEIFTEKTGVSLSQKTASLRKKSIITLVFEKKRQFFCRKLAKIRESSDHNIEP